MSAKQRQDYLNHLESWGIEDLTDREIREIRNIFGDRAQQLLDYYSFTS